MFNFFRIFLKFLVIFLVSVVIGTLVLAYQHRPCSAPLLYSIGQFDQRFGISESEFLSDLATAESVWEKPLGKELFRYSPDAPFQVNLIFDERQQRTMDAKKLEASRGETESTQENLSETQSKLVAEYDALLNSYKKDLSALERRLEKYNEEVEHWNKRGGAPPEEYEKLQDEAEDLEKREKDLKKKEETVNALAEKINSFSKKQVAVVEEFNSQVKEFANRYGEHSEFDEGLYKGTAIDIYQFEDRGQLRVVLAHELGHAFGLGHVENPASIMYHLMQAQVADPVTLTPEDLAAATEVCSQSPFTNLWETFFPNKKDQQE